MRAQRKVGKHINRALLIAAVAVGSFISNTSAANLQGAPSREEVRDEFHQTYPLSANGRVSLENINGAVRVTAWERNEVRVDAVKRAYTRERLDEAQIKVEATNDSVSIKTEYPNSTMNWTRDEGGRHRNPASVEYTLSVPRGARLDKIDLINGALQIEGVSGDVNASSINGRLTARGLSGETKLSVINGRLEATFDRLDDAKPVSLTSVNGSMVLMIPSDANVELRASTVHGGISNDFGLPVRRGEYVGSDLAGVVGRGGARIKLSNVNGSISIKRTGEGRAANPAQSLLSETKDERADADESRTAAREAAREAREVKREAKVMKEEIKREVQREMRESVRRGVGQGIGEGIGRGIGEGIGEGIGSAVGEGIRRGVEGAGGGDRYPRRIERETKSFPVSGSPRLRLETFDGHITVRAWEKPEVMYTAIKRAGSDEELRGVRLRAEQNGAEVNVIAEFDKNFSREVVKRDDQVVSYSSGASVELEVYVPRNAALKVSSGDGRLRVEGVSGEMDLHTGDGPVDVAGGGGRLRADTGDGSIRITDFDGAADARTGDGRITLDGRFAELAAQSGDGSITLALPADTNAVVETEAETVANDGVAVVDDGSNVEARRRRWRVGSGGNKFTLRTGDGQIILRRR